MQRTLLLLAAAFLLVLALAPALPAQEAAGWPYVAPPTADPHSMTRGPGYYLSIPKIVFLVLLFWVWVKTCDWLSQDCQRAGMPYALWVPLMTGPFFFGFFLFGLGIPIFFLGYLVLLICYGAPLGVYIWQRNSKLPPHLRVLTPDHLRHLVATRVNRAGGKMDSEKKAAHEKGAPVTFSALGAATEQENQSNLIGARQAPGFLAAKELIADALVKRTEKIMLDYTAAAAGVKYYVDGVWHDLPSRDRESGDALLVVLKKLANLKVEDRKNRQEGKLGAEFRGTKYVANVLSQGTPTGEKVILTVAGKQLKFESLEALGMRDKMKDQVKEILGRDKGFILFSAMPSGGLTTTVTMSLRNTDRFMRDFFAVEAANAREPEVENVEVMPYDPAQQETALATLTKVMRKQPAVVVCRELTPEVMKVLLDQVLIENKMSIGAIRAKEAVEALVRVLALPTPAGDLAEAAIAVLNERLIRKLCEKCKVGYEPSADLLKKLGIPAGRVHQFFREPQPSDYEKPPTEPCSGCGGIAYVGRTAIYELLVVEDKLRQALRTQPKLDTLKAVARQAGHRGLMEEGILLVAKGVTSLAELQRVLKQ